MSFSETVITTDRIEGTIEFVTMEAPARSALGAGLARTLTEAEGSDPGCPEACAQWGLAILLSWFDTNDDGIYGEDEVAASPFFDIDATVDVFSDIDGATIYWPGHDGDPDGIGASVAFAGHRVALVQ